MKKKNKLKEFFILNKIKAIFAGIYLFFFTKNMIIPNAPEFPVSFVPFIIFLAFILFLMICAYFGGCLFGYAYEEFFIKKRY